MILIGSEECLILAQQLQKRMVLAQKNLVSAESCTGGLLASLLTHHAGSSGFYRGGVSAYCNEVKEKVLGVSPEILARHGAVSGETALAMAQGVLTLLKGDFSIAITGVAGPGGGSPSKPVGTIYLALSRDDSSYSKKFILGDNRLDNRSNIIHLALEELIQFTSHL